MNETTPAAKTSGSDIPATCMLRAVLAAHHAATAHRASVHHRLHSLPDKAAHLARVLPDRSRDLRVVRGFGHGNALPCEPELTPVAARVAEEDGEALAHAGHLEPVFEVVVHACDVGLKLSDELGRIGLSQGAYAARHDIDGASELSMAVEELHVGAHVGARSHHPPVPELRKEEFPEG